MDRRRRRARSPTGSSSTHRITRTLDKEILSLRAWRQGSFVACLKLVTQHQASLRIYAFRGPRNLNASNLLLTNCLPCITASMADKISLAPSDFTTYRARTCCYSKLPAPKLDIGSR